MTHDELLARIDNPDAWDSDGWGYLQKALRAVVEMPEKIHNQSTHKLTARVRGYNQALADMRSRIGEQLK